jgi:hypothetical protein
MLALVLFVGLAGSVALALKETRPRNPVVQQQDPEAATSDPSTSPLRGSAQGEREPELSTAGKLPFGMVPGAEEDRDSSGDIPDEVDRCPNEPEDGREDYDGCPEPETTPRESNHEVDGKLIYW